MTAILFLAQRATAFVLALAVAVHLGTILYAVRGGLTAADILARTHGNIGFAAVLRPVRGRGRDPRAHRIAQCLARMDAHGAGVRSTSRSRHFRVLLLVLGLRAVFAVYTA